MSDQETQDIVPGKLYRIQHSRKGTFVARIIDIKAGSGDTEWVEAEIVDGAAAALNPNNRAYVGDTLTVRRGLCRFFEMPEAFPERDPERPAEEQGLFRKFVVMRVDGSSREGGKHHGCEYFVLDMRCDPFAVPALRAYAEACAETHPALADDLRTWLADK